MNIDFNCPQCGNTVIVDEVYRGSAVECPHCHKGIVVPRAKPKLKPLQNVSQTTVVKCPHCGMAYEVNKKDLNVRSVCQECGKSFILGEEKASGVAIPRRLANPANEKAHEEIRKKKEEVSSGMPSPKEILKHYIYYILTTSIGISIWLGAVIVGVCRILMAKFDADITTLVSVCAIICLVFGLSLNWFCYDKIIVKKLMGKRDEKCIKEWFLSLGIYDFLGLLINNCLIYLFGIYFGWFLGVVLNVGLGYLAFRFIIVRNIAKQSVAWEKITTWSVVSVLSFFYLVFTICDMFGVSSHSGMNLEYEFNAVNQLTCHIGKYDEDEKFVEGVAYPLTATLPAGSVIPSQGFCIDGHFFKTDARLFDGDRITGVWICCGRAHFRDSKGRNVTGRAFRKMNKWIADYRIAQLNAEIAKERAEEAARERQRRIKEAAEKKRREEAEERERNRERIETARRNRLDYIDRLVMEIKASMSEVNSILNGKRDEGFKFSTIKEIDNNVEIAIEVVSNVTSGNLNIKSDETSVSSKIEELESEKVRVNNRLKELNTVYERYKQILREKEEQEKKRRAEEAARELESRKEVCSPCQGKGTVPCAQCKGNGSIIIKGTKPCSKCGGSVTTSWGEETRENGKGTVEVAIKCNRCNGYKMITPRCMNCNGKGRVKIVGGGLSLKTYETCSSCNGSGRGNKEFCDKCSGEGTLKVVRKCPICHGRGELVTGTSDTCPACKGVGKIKCDRCEGKGFTYRPKE